MQIVHLGLDQVEKQSPSAALYPDNNKKLFQLDSWQPSFSNSLGDKTHKVTYTVAVASALL